MAASVWDTDEHAAQMSSLKEMVVDARGEMSQNRLASRWPCGPADPSLDGVWIYARRGLIAATALLVTALAACSTGGRPSGTARPLTVPGCSNAIARTRTLASVPHTMTRVPPDPFGVLPTPDGRWVFVIGSVGVTVLRTAPPGQPPQLVRTVALPDAGIGLGGVLTPGARYLLAATSGGTVVLDTARLESGAAHPVLGTLPGTGGTAAGAIEVAVSPSGGYAFTTLEDAKAVEVSDLARALSAGFGARGVAVGRVPTSTGPVGIQVSPGGTWLYVTSFADGPAGASAAGRCPDDPNSSPGNLRVVSVATAEHDPSRAVRAVAAAGAGPVRVVLSPSGALAWVADLGGNALLGFATARLDAGQPALVADVPVGEDPVGAAPVDGGRFVVTADSDRYGGTGPQWLSVVNVRDALAGRPALAGQIPAGSFPRELALSPDGRTLYVSNYGSSQLETIPVAALIRAVTHGS